MQKDAWKQIALAPLSGLLDTRSRPAEMSPGTFRYKLNLSVNRSGALCTRSGHEALNFGSRSDSPGAVPNWDFHRRDASSRDAITFQFESTSPTGYRRLFAGTPSSLSYLDNDTSEWTNLVNGASGAVWKAAALQDKIVFVNNLDPGVLLHTLTSTTASSTGFTWTAGASITRARVVVSFGSVVMLMNVDQAGTNHYTRIWWSDYEDASSFDAAAAESVAGFIDLDYGDTILNAAEMMGALYIFTARSIWRCVVNVTTTTLFSFAKIYSEPKNGTGCLVYANTLATNGRELYWWSSDSIWTFNPYLVAPESTDWLLRGSGALFSRDDADRMERRCCDTIVGEYHPITKEIWFSYPQGSDTETAVCINNRCLVLNTEYKTMDLVDHGYSSFVNFRRTPGSGEECNADPIFIGASSSDYCLKSIGGVFYRESVTLVGGARGNEIPDASYAVTQSGYFCRVVGAIPLGYPNLQKVVRELLLDAEITPNNLASANLLTLRIGNSFALQDPMSTGASCAVQWHDQDSLPLTCPDEATIAAMTAAGERPSDPLAWTIWEIGNRLYYDLRITASDGVSAPVDHEVKFSAFRFDVLLQ